MSDLKLPLRVARDLDCDAVEVCDITGNPVVTIWVDSLGQRPFCEHIAEIIVAALTADAEKEERDAR